VRRGEKQKGEERRREGKEGGREGGRKERRKEGRREETNRESVLEPDMPYKGVPGDLLPPSRPHHLTACSATNSSMN
jgi:hypothetical protein